MNRFLRARWRGLAPLLLLLACTAPCAHATPFDPAFPRTSLNGPADAVPLLAGAENAIARTELITGTQSIVLPFFVPDGMPGGTVSVTLTDLAFPGPMSSLSFAASTSTSVLGMLAHAGSGSFQVPGAGAYFATVFGVADPTFGAGLYSLRLELAPVPLPGAALLFASAIALLARRRRGKESVINAR